MNQLSTTGIVLARTDYGEADRILTLLTPEYGKLRLMAKGVRRVKSKLAGGIELFSVSDITFIKGRGDMGTLVSARLAKHYGKIVHDLDRTMLGYDLIKLLNRNTEDESESAYFELLKQSFEALDDDAISMQIIRFWFNAKLLSMNGHIPNLHSDAGGTKLQAAGHYNFDFDTMSFAAAENGRFSADHIKFLRLCFAASSPKLLAQVQGADELATATAPLVTTMLHTYANT